MAGHGHHNVTTNAIMEKGLFRNLIGLGLVAVLFYFALKAYTSLIEEVVDSSTDWIAQRFSRSVSYIHQEWMFNSKPSVLVLPYNVSATEVVKIPIQLNEQGWPLNVDAKDRQLNCLNLWMLFANEQQTESSILDVTDRLQIREKNKGCEYYYTDKGSLNLIFSYNIYSGKVDAIKLD